MGLGLTIPADTIKTKNNNPGNGYANLGIIKRKTKKSQSFCIAYHPTSAAATRRTTNTV